MPTVTLQDMLSAKERRSQARQRMLADHPGVCISLSLNIPGEEKLSPRIRSLFSHAVARIVECFQVQAITGIEEPTGPYALFSVSGSALEAKQKAIRLEERGTHGRLLDIDVYDAVGRPVSAQDREGGRRCFICRLPAAVCMRQQKHAGGEIQAAVDAMFTDFYADRSRSISPLAEEAASLGLEALLHEVAACPSPGLVDTLHTGSHRDMDFFTFQKSSAALAHGLARCAEAGLRHESGPDELLPVLRCIGQEAEKNMFRATSGVNTQKGALFSMGLVLGATGLLLRDRRQISPGSISGEVTKIAAGLVSRELQKPEARTAGEKAYRNFGISGIRGEIEHGLPSVLKFGLPTLEAGLARGESINRAMIRTLLALMSEVDDTTIIHRAGTVDALRQVQERARGLLASGLLDDENWQDAVWKLDAELVDKNISPGGAADLLAVTWFLYRAGTLNRRSQDEGI